MSRLEGRAAKQKSFSFEHKALYGRLFRRKETKSNYFRDNGNDTGKQNTRAQWSSKNRLTNRGRRKDGTLHTRGG